MLSALLGLATDIDPKKLDAEFAELLVDGERIEHAYKLVRDLLVFTNLRFFLVDKQGLTGKKRQYTAIPYRSVDSFTKETAGHFDLDAEIKVHIKGRTEPLVLEFRKDTHIHEVFRMISRHVLAT
jgi:hypothetical protein